jgi:hypothetical protein
VLTVPATALPLWLHYPTTALWIGIAGGVLTAVFFIGGAVARASNLRRGRDLAAYEARSAEREGWRAVLASLAQRWGGTLETTGTDLLTTFLVEHWPERVPWQLLRGFRTAGEDRLTVAATVGGLPTLVHVVDFWQPHPTRRPPVLFLLVACPLAPVDSDPGIPRLSATLAEGRLGEAGWWYGLGGPG